MRFIIQVEYGLYSTKSNDWKTPPPFRKIRLSAAPKQAGRLAGILPCQREAGGGGTVGRLKRLSRWRSDT